MTPKILAKLHDLVTPGLVAGLGVNAPGGMCIEAAVSLAVHGVFGDTPSCVGDEDRSYALRINDAKWSSPQARAEALLPLAIAQIGTAGRDRSAWVARLAEGTIRKIVPMALRAAAASVHLETTHRQDLETAAVRCEQEGTREAAEIAAYASASTSASAYASASAYTSAYAVAAYASAANSAKAAYYAATAANAAARTSGAARTSDAVLRASVQIALDAYAEETT